MSDWVPSRRERHFLWWLQVVMRFGVGGGGLVWEVALDKLRNPLALIVFGALATSMDVFAYIKELVRQAQEQRVGIERELIEEELQSEHDEKPPGNSSSPR